MAGEELPAVGETIGGYRLDRLIASGGMGAVFAATHTKLGRRAAIKVLDHQFATDQEHVARFLFEARIANGIKHPNIIEVFDFIESGEHIALVMELLEGPTLSNALSRVGRFSIVQSLNMALQLANAAAAVHAAGVVHRDLKPQNLLMIQPLDSEFWDPPSFKILDFGIAKQDHGSPEYRTVQGALMGTPAYMAPEQVAGSAVSPATDIYAIGEILFEMATGRRLFDGESALVLTQKLKHQLPRYDMPRNVRGGERVARIARTCTTPDPELRPTVTNLVYSLTELLEEFEDLEQTEMVDEGAATILALEIPKRKAESIDAIPAMNTQMFLDRILDDIEDVSQPEVRPPPKRPDSIPELDYAPSRGSSFPPLPPMSSPISRPNAPVIVGTPAPRPASTIPQRALSIAAYRSSVSQPAVLAPPPVKAKPKRRFLWLLMAPALVMIVMVAVPAAQEWARSSFDQLIGATPNPVRRHLAAWKEVHGEVSGPASEHLAEALSAHAADTWPKYQEAEFALQRALILEPNNPAAIALWAENQLAWKELLLLGAEAEEVMRFLEYARALDANAVLRADARRAEVVGDPARCRELARAAQAKDSSDAIAISIEGECTIEQDPATAEALIFKASSQRVDLGRAARIGARARARNGAYATAIKTLDQRLTKDPKNGPTLIEAAAIDHSIGLHERELLRLRAATRADGDQLRAQLMLGKAQVELQKESSARSTLLSLAEHEDAPGRYRREAYVTLARLELAADAPQKTLDLLGKAAAFGTDPAAETLMTGALLALARPNDVIAQIGQARATEEDLPLLVALGGAHVLNGRPDEAKHSFEAAVAVRPQDPRLFAFLAGARALLDDFGAARGALDKMTWLDPLEVLEDDRAPELPSPVGRILVERLEKMRDGAGDQACVDAVLAVLWFYAGAREEALEAAERSAAARNPPPPRTALVIDGYLVLDADPKRADALAARIAKEPPSASGQLFLARLEATKKDEGAADAYAKALSINPDLPLAKVERTALELKRKKKETVEELRALHVAYSSLGKLRRLLFRATE